jgi:hypothetical protein
MNKFKNLCFFEPNDSIINLPKIHTISHWNDAIFLFHAKKLRQFDLIRLIIDDNLRGREEYLPVFDINLDNYGNPTIDQSKVCRKIEIIYDLVDLPEFALEQRADFSFYKNLFNEFINQFYVFQFSCRDRILKSIFSTMPPTQWKSVRLVFLYAKRTGYRLVKVLFSFNDFLEEKEASIAIFYPINHPCPKREEGDYKEGIKNGNILFFYNDNLPKVIEYMKSEYKNEMAIIYDAIMAPIIAFKSLDLPIYIFFEIMEWNPLLAKCKRIWKVRVIEKMVLSIKRICARKQVMIMD